jgi:hypothetical protein
MKQSFEAIDTQLDSEVRAREAELLKKPFDIETEVDNRPELNYYNYDVQEVEEIFIYSEKAEQLNLYLEDYHQEILRSFRNGDWLHIYSAAIKDWGMDMNNVMRVSISQGRKQPDDYATELASIFGTGSKPTWETVADYSSFLASLYESAQASTLAPNAKENYEMITDQIVKQMEIVDGEELLRSQSVYEKIKHNKYQLGQVGERQTGIREELKEFAKLERRLLSQRVARENVETLA